MRAAFSSKRQAAAFALLLLGLLLLPVLLRKPLLPSRERLYSSGSWGIGAFPYIHDQIFDETGDIDIALMGSSPISWGIDTPYLQAKLSEKLGRQAVVRSLGWSWVGFDPLYFISRDLLEHRRVRMIIFCDCSPGAADTANIEAARWFRFADDAQALHGLPLRSQASFYASALLGAPRNLLSLLRADLPAVASDEVSWEDFKHVPSPALRLGNFAIPPREPAPWADLNSAKLPEPGATLVYSPATKESFRFIGARLYPLQLAMTRKVAALAREHGVKLVCLHIPQVSESQSAVIAERSFWPDTFQGELLMVGIPGRSLFAGMSDQDVRKLYYDFQHFNANGQKYFTRAIAPALIELYEQQVKP